MNHSTPCILRIVLALMFMGPATSFAQEAPSALFDEGTQALQNGNFQEAIAAYDRARASGQVSAELFHNMGVAWYRMDQAGRAILFLERAHQLEPDSEAIAHSLMMAQRLRQDTFSALPTPFWKRAHRWILDRASPGLLFAFGTAFLFLWGGVAGARLWARKSIAHSERLERWALTLAVPLLGFALYSSAAPPWPERSIVLATSVNLTEQAAPESPVVEQLHAGSEVHVRARGDGWVFVRLTNGVEGWLPEDTIASI